jgi:hypothetical protein
MRPTSEKWHQVVSSENACELLRVVLDCDSDDPELYVEILHELVYAEDWGTRLAFIVRAMAEQHSNYLQTDRDDGDVFAGICDGFFATCTAERPKEDDRRPIS